MDNVQKSAATKDSLMERNPNLVRACAHIAGKKYDSTSNRKRKMQNPDIYVRQNSQKEPGSCKTMVANSKESRYTKVVDTHCL